ncbi:MAG: penicillin-binding transpeptidase domain-containing protein [Oscillospiraceae bacterium]|nr:penicillin-binding transpeptidase domain-containing protein [Oscillospiraceae bacterium]
MKEKWKSSRRLNRSVLRRTVVLAALFGVFLFVPLGWRLYQIQIVEGAQYERQAVAQQIREEVLRPVRGNIFDRNYNTLAACVRADTLILAPKVIKDEAQAILIAQGLSRILDVSYDKVYALTQLTDRLYEVVKRRVEGETAEAVLAFIKENKLGRAVYFETDYRRNYPNGDFSSHVLGFVSGMLEGLDGVEKIYDSYLTGTAGRVISAKDGREQSIPFLHEKTYEAQNGHDLILTLDSTIQNIVSTHLKEAVIDHQVTQRAAAIVMDVHTGEILAMDAQGGFDPNAPREITDLAALELLDGLSGAELDSARETARLAQWRNKAVVDTYEPGSTFKIITAAIALEEKAVSPDDTFFCSGYVMVPGWGSPIHCHRLSGHGDETFVSGMQNSCNPVMITVAQRVGTEKYYEYFKAFGFTEKTGIDLPGESKGVHHTWSAFDNLVTLSTYSFGQTFTLTPIQLVTAVSAIANGGNLMKPHVVRALVDAKGNVVKSFEPEVVRKVISQETSKQLCSILETVVSRGTGRNAYVAGYRVAGKTGTSQKRNVETGAYTQGKYVVSFVAFAPADDPKVALLVMLDEPMSEPSNLRTGGGMAAPAAGRMLSEILPYLQVEPKYTEEELLSAEIVVPSVQGMSRSDAENLLDYQGVNYRMVGGGGNVTLQVPKAGERIAGTTEMVLYLGEGTPIETAVVPDVFEMSMDEADKVLRLAGFFMSATGAAATDDAEIFAYAQDFPADQEAPTGSVVHVEFREKSLQD